MVCHASDEQEFRVAKNGGLSFLPPHQLFSGLECALLGDKVLALPLRIWPEWSYSLAIHQTDRWPLARAVFSKHARNTYTVSEVLKHAWRHIPRILPSTRTQFSRTLAVASAEHFARYHFGLIFTSYPSVWLGLQHTRVRKTRHISNVVDSADVPTKYRKGASPRVLQLSTRNNSSTTDSSVQNFFSWVEMPKNIVQTFSREALLMEDAVDFSGQYQAEIMASSRVRRLRSPTSSDMVFHYGIDVRTNSYLPFPPNTKGFLYYHLPEGYPPLAGSFRFRVVPSGHPRDFQTAADLHGRDGKPWSVALLEVPRAHPYKHTDRDISRILKRDGVVSLEESDACHAFAARRLKRRIAYRGQPCEPDQILHIRNPRFLLRFDAKEIPLHVIDGTQVESMSIASPLQATVGVDGVLEFPYRGEAVCEFIESPKSEFLSIRVLDINAPVTKSLSSELYPYNDEHGPAPNKILLGADGKPVLVPSSPALRALLRTQP